MPRWMRRILAVDAPVYEAAGWVRVAADWSPSVGALALMEHPGDVDPGDLTMTHPNLGDRVKVWPMPGLQVQAGSTGFGQFLSSDGREVVWDSYWHRRLLEGAVMLEPPGEVRMATPPKAEDVKKPAPATEPAPQE